MEKGSLDVAGPTSSNIAAMRGIDNKVVNVLSTYVGKNEEKRQNATAEKRKKHQYTSA